MAESKTEPAFSLPRSLSQRRPWWLAALLSGVGIGIGVVVTLGLAGSQARGESPMRSSSMTMQAPTDAEWRAQISAKLNEMGAQQNEMGQRLARIEGRMERR